MKRWVGLGVIADNVINIGARSTETPLLPDHIQLLGAERAAMQEFHARRRLGNRLVRTALQ
jgi:hypothetical protein